MATVDTSGLDRITNRIRRVNESSQNLLNGIAERSGETFLRNLRKRQPVGKPDPLVVKGFSSRPERPSVRQGNDPIERGWLGPFVESPKPGTATVTINTSSPHLKYFTRWTGRAWLGTHAGRPQVATHSKSLFFWWMGAARTPQSVRGHGFNVPTDFVEDAWTDTKPFVDKEVDGFATYVIRNLRGDQVG